MFHTKTVYILISKRTWKLGGVIRITVQCNYFF